jgi:MFS transporter, SP family, galactose:H+ symporter
LHHNQQKSYVIAYTVMIVFFSTIAGLLFGFDTGVISGALPFIAKSFDINASHYFLKGCIVSAVPLGALIGALFSKPASFHVGRRRSILITAVLFMIGTGLVAYAQDINMVLVGRVLMGLAVGLSAMIVPMYLSEVSAPQSRGAVVFCFQLAITVGLLMAFVINYIFSDAENWRAMFEVGLIPAVLLYIGMLILPSSPRWLALKGEDQKAKRVLAKIRGTQDIEREFNEIKATTQHKRGGLKLALANPVRVLVIITFGLFMFQQFSGINTIMYYAPVIYHNAGFQSVHQQYLWAMADGMVFVLATLIGIVLVDRLGRRPLFFIGFVGMIICLAGLGAIFQGHWHAFSENLSIVMVLGYIVFFGISLGPLCYLMMSELFPLNVKGTGMALASCSNWGFNVVVSATFLTLIHFLGIGHTFYLYAGLTCVGLVFMAALVPETKGRSLEEIEANLYNNIKARHLGRAIPSPHYD